MASAHLGLVLLTGGDGGVSRRLPFYSTPWPTHLPPDGGGGGCCKSLLFFRSRPCFTLDGIKHRSNLLESRHPKSLLPDPQGSIGHPASLPETSTGTSEPSKGSGRTDEEVSVGGGGGGGRKRGGQEQEDGRRELGRELSVGAVASAIEEAMRFRDFNIIAACTVGLLTGIAVVFFNNAINKCLGA